MTTPFAMPDEYLQGFLKAAQSWAQSLAPASAAADTSVPRAGGAALLELHAGYLQQQLQLWSRSLAGSTATEPVVAPERGDRRFSAGAWRELPGYSLLVQTYLLNSRLLTELVEATDLDPATRHKVRFFTRQFIDAMSPANCAATNPDVLKAAQESQGQSLQSGLQNLLADLRKGGLTITDEHAFEVGTNVAVSAGSVIFENELFQLIQYAPLTDKVASRPLLIVPPCINKFYILDLQPNNSFVRYAVEQGLTVFLVSWRNPDASAGHLRWDDYVEDGALKALEIAHAVSGADKVNALGWCVGGTILSSALAVMRARGGNTAASLTLLTTMLDFRDPGDLGVFIDEQSVQARESSLGQGGIYPGSELGFVFQTLRANDLIWPNVINHYLKGKSPEAFDLLYWNADATNLPGPMYAWYLRNMYLENNLRVPNKLMAAGTPVDIGRLDMPSYVLATQEDHIVPWRSAYQTTQLVGGKCRFVLGASGHIAGVINPASKNKRSWWSGGTQGTDAEQWLQGARETPGSWWTDWHAWLAPKCGKPVPAPRKPGNRMHKPIEPAPGRYVKVKAKVETR